MSTLLLAYSKNILVDIYILLVYAYIKIERRYKYMMKYYKLFDMLQRRNMKKTDLLTVISAPTLAKLSKGDSVTTDILCKICDFLDCQPGDIMEFEKGGN